MKKIYFRQFLPLLLLFTFSLTHVSYSQVYTNYYAASHVSAKGFYSRSDKMETIILPPQNNEALLRSAPNANHDAPFKFATPVKVDIAPGKQGQWEQADNGLLVWRVKIVSSKAFSTSIDFDQFKLSEDAEMYIYNSDGTMITGPITYKENNDYNLWGSSIYAGESLIVEVKVPAPSVGNCLLHINNFSHGYRNLFKTEKVFGASGTCNINVLCAAGTAWSAERNSVALVLNASSSEHCSGTMVMNACATDIPYFLTANHCYTASGAGSVSNWKFIFQYWSPNCTPNADGSRSVLFNGATLRANNATSDFTLLELNSTPPSTSGITYAGWNRYTYSSITNTTGIHHPSGDVMKISIDNDAPLRANYLGASGSGSSHWMVDWNSGVTEGGSSGSALFDQNHRIIGQLHGGYSSCTSSDLRDWYGAFDVSWTGGGTNATRLSTWLDPGGSGIIATSTTDISALTSGLSTGPLSLNISGSSGFCSGSQTYTLSGAPAGATITWTSSNPAVGSISSAGGTTATLTKQAGDGSVVVTATVNGTCQSTSTAEIFLGIPYVMNVSFTNAVGGEGYFCSSHYGNEFSITPFIPSTSYDIRLLSYPSLSVVYTAGPISGNSGTVGYTTSPGWFVFEARPTNACGTGDWTGYEVEYIDCTGWGRQSGEASGIKTYPNPAKGTLYVTIDKENQLAKSATASNPIQATLYHFYTGQIVKQWQLTGNSTTPQKLNISQVKKGQYILVLSADKHRVTKQVVIE